MVNVTISLDEATARWARIEAAKAGKSVSRWVGEVLNARREAETDQVPDEPLDAQQRALAVFLSTPTRKISDKGRLPTREELYDEMFRGYERPGVREGQSSPYKTEEGE